MLILGRVQNTINISESIGSVGNFFNIIWPLIGLLLIGFAIYMKIKDIKFKKHGVEVNTTVLSCEAITKDINGEKLKVGYKTTFELDIKGNKREKTMTTQKRFVVGNKYKGVFLDDGKDGTLSVRGEGFYLAKGGEIIIFAFGVVFLIVGLYMFFDIPLKVILLTVALLFIIVLGYRFIFPVFQKSNNKSKKNQIYYELTEDEFSNIDQSLVRYIPKKDDRKSSIILSIFGLTIFLVIGASCIALGIKESIKTYKIRFNYPSMKATITEAYTYEVKKEEGSETLAGIKCKYTVDGKPYEKDFKTTHSPNSSLKEGKLVKLYYNESNPEDSVLRIELDNGFGFIVMGLFWLFIAGDILIDLNYTPELDESKSKLEVK